MLQLGTLRPWITPEGELKHVFKYIKGFHYEDLKTLFESIEDDINKYLVPEEQYNIFYTVAHHLKGQRKKASWQAQDLIPFDLDGIDLDQIDEYPKAVGEALEIDINKCGIVYSGNGCHVLIQVEVFKDKEYIKNNKLGYRQLYDRIVAKCNEKGLPITKDTTAWDYARILRAPFTINRKSDKDGKVIEKKCILINSDIETQGLEIPSAEEVKHDFFMPSGSFPKADSEEILKECSFFQWLQHNPEEVHEPHAYAMLSITGHFDDDNKTSEELYEKFSSPSINSKTVAEFTEQALKASGPRTCEGINDIWGKCKTCPHYKTIRSPILLKGENFIGTSHCGFTLKGARGGIIRQYEDLLKQFRKEYRHKSVGAIKKVYVYTGTHFRLTNDTELRNFAHEKFFPMAKSDERREFMGLVKDSNYTTEEFLEGSANEGLINLKNGVLNIKTGELLPHKEEYNFLYCLPFNYNPNATAPRWSKFLDEITLGRKELANILEEYLGYIISGSPYKYQKALILDGQGKNGKTTFVKLLKKLVGGENISNVSIEQLQGNVFSSSGLHGKLVNISEEEPPKSFREKNGVFKNITGDGTVNAQYKYGDPFEFTNKAKLVITYNEMPYMADTSTGMLRRLLVVPFDYDLEKENSAKVDPEIDAKLEAELEGIFNLAIAGYKRLEAQKGFTKSKDVSDKVREIQLYSDPVQRFLDENCEVTGITKDEIWFSDLYNAYIRFHEGEGAGVKFLTKTGFWQRLKKERLTRDRVQKNAMRGYMVRGVVLNTYNETTRVKL